MVEASTELLGGAAVTVFLALLFFGVVVLWDVALALRSVGDKIDKLEDNIDDDLTDIAHSLDGISNAPGGGGTQLHLSGGTISSGPGANQAQQPHQSQQTPQAGQQQGAGPQGAAGPQQAAAGQTEQPGGVGQRPQHQQPRAARRESDVREGPTAGAGLEDPEQTEPDRSAEEHAAASDEPPHSDVDEIDESDDARSDADPEPDEGTASEESPHPRAEINRGRFITSPDRTAWYATPLDREAIEAARPTIAGALPDGSDTGVDESEIIAAGPPDSGEATAAGDGDGDADEATAMPASDADETDGTGTDEGTDDEGGDDGGAAAEAAADEDVDETAADDAHSIDESDDESTADDPAAGDQASGTTAESATDTDAADEDREPTDATDDAAIETEDRTELEGATADDAVPESPGDVDVLSFEEGAAGEAADANGEDRTDVPDLADEPGETEFPAAESESEAADDSEDETATGSESEADDAADDLSADGLTEFEFDESEFEADDEDVTVEEAVDTMNEDAPAPELSSHRFDVTADDRDDGSAVLTFEFETDTVDITGSTERLLQYQMRSFADRESTPDGDVTIDRDRIVIEIPDSDGAAVQQWGEAAVSIIDRTLYLSDNSTDS